MGRAGPNITLLVILASLRCTQATTTTTWSTSTTSITASAAGSTSTSTTANQTASSGWISNSTAENETVTPGSTSTSAVTRTTTSGLTSTSMTASQTTSRLTSTSTLVTQTTSRLTSTSTVATQTTSTGIATTSTVASQTATVTNQTNSVANLTAFTVTTSGPQLTESSTVSETTGTTTQTSSESGESFVASELVSVVDVEDAWYEEVIEMLGDSPEEPVVYDVGSSEPRVWIIGLPAMVAVNTSLWLDLDGPQLVLPASTLRALPSGLGLTVAQVARAALGPPRSPQGDLKASEELLEITMVDLPSAASGDPLMIEAKHLREPLFFKFSGNYEAESPCAYYVDDEWSQDGLYRPTEQEIRHHTGPDVDVSGWCASRHLSLFTILLKASEVKHCAVFGSGFDPSSDCFDAVLFFTVLSIPLIFCCCSCCVYCYLRHKKIKGGKLELKDVHGNKQEFKFTVARGLVEGAEQEAAPSSKTVVKWDVDLEQAQDVGFNYLDAQLQVTEAVSLHESEMAHVKTNRSEGPKSPRKLLSEAEDEVEQSEQLLMSDATLADDISIGAEEAEVEDHGSELKKVSSGIGYEAYARDTFVEYFSSTHRRWLHGSIAGDGVLQDDLMPCYTVMIQPNALKQLRDLVPMERLREPFRSRQPVYVRFYEDWLAGIVRARRVRKPGYTVNFITDPLYEVALGGKSATVDAEEVRPRFPAGQVVEVYEGVTSGWREGVVQSEEWPMVVVRIAGVNARCFHYHVRVVMSKLGTKAVTRNIVQL